jgi:hypothetical protein
MGRIPPELKFFFVLVVIQWIDLGVHFAAIQRQRAGQRSDVLLTPIASSGTIVNGKR